MKTTVIRLGINRWWFIHSFGFGWKKDAIKIMNEMNGSKLTGQRIDKTVSQILATGLPPEWLA